MIKHYSSDKFFFLLTGENPELAIFEFESILITLNVQAQINTSLDNRIIEFSLKNDDYKDISLEIVMAIMQRITMAHFCCKELYQVSFLDNLPSSFEELKSLFRIDSIRNLKTNLSFSVKTLRINNPKGILKDRSLTPHFSSYLGEQIQQENPGKRVDLDNPDEKFIAILSQYGIWFGKFLFKSRRSEVRLRTSHNRPFFHPSSMNPILQRTLINLAALKPGEWLLDPFCGTGGALLEASRLNFYCVGVEIDRRMIWGACQNLAADHETNKFTHLVFGDATKSCFKNKSFSAIVTDPPYGTTASTQGYNLSELLLIFLQSIRSLLKPNSRVVFAVPSHLKIEQKAAQILEADFKVFYQYVHRSLTRKILVFKLR